MGQQHPTLPITITPRNDRPYVHTECGGVTILAGDAIQKVTHPYTFVLATYCTNCGGLSSLDAVKWQDTGESLTDYRYRLGCLSPWWVNWMPLLVPIVFAAIAAAIGWLYRTGTPYDGAVTLVYAGCGAFAGFFLGWVGRTMVANHWVGHPWFHID